MNELLIGQMATDMSMSKFHNETNKSFHLRVLYSGLALWLKTIMLDDFENTTGATHSVSKKHSYTRFSTVLVQFINFFPEYREWLNPDVRQYSDGDTVHFLRNRMIAVGEIYQCENSLYISLPSAENEIISPFITRHYGIGSNIPLKHSGVASYLLGQNNKMISKKNKESAESFLNHYFHTLEKETHLYQRELVFSNPLAKTDTFHYSWEKKPPVSSVYLARTPKGENGNKHFLIRTKNGNLEQYALTESHLKSQIQKKLLLAIRKVNGNPVKVIIQKEKEYFTLERYVKSFPFPDEAMVQSYGTPVESITDTLSWIFPITFYGVIEQTLENLFLEIVKK